MGAGGEDQKRHDDRGDASDDDLEHAVDGGFNRAHVGESGNQEHQRAGKGRGAEARHDRSEQRQRRDGDHEDARE